MAFALEGREPPPHQLRPGPAQVLRPGHVPLPFGRRASRRPLRGLHRHRHHHALEAHAGLERPAPDGLGRLRPARRELRHQDRGPPPRHHRAGGRQLPPPDRLGGVRLRLGAGGQHDRPRLLQVDAVDLPAPVRQGPGLRGHGPHQLVPLLQDGPGQRGGDPGPLRALRDAGRPQGHAPVAPAHHPLRRPPAGRPERGRLARIDAGHAAQLDRPLRGGRGVLPAGRIGGRATVAAGRSGSSPPGPTRCSARPTWCWRPSTRWWPS